MENYNSGKLYNKKLPYDIESLHNQKQALRDEINRLKIELQEKGGEDNVRNI